MCLTTTNYISFFPYIMKKVCQDSIFAINYTPKRENRIYAFLSCLFFCHFLLGKILVTSLNRRKKPPIVMKEVVMDEELWGETNPLG